jgi:hypothetical protein
MGTMEGRRQAPFVCFNSIGAADCVCAVSLSCIYDDHTHHALSDRFFVPKGIRNLYKILIFFATSNLDLTVCTPVSVVCGSNLIPILSEAVIILTLSILAV